MKKYITLSLHRISQFKKATIDGFHEITVTTNVPFNIKEKKIEIEGIKIKNITPYDINSGDITNKVKIITEQKIDLKQTYKVKIENLADTNTEIGKVIRSEEFDNLFYYGGNDLEIHILRNIQSSVYGLLLQAKRS